MLERLVRRAGRPVESDPRDWSSSRSSSLRWGWPSGGKGWLTAEDLEEFNEALAAQRIIDDPLWR